VLGRWGSRSLPSKKGLHDHTHSAHHTWQEPSVRGISPSQIPLQDNTQKSQETNNRAPSGITTDNASKRAALDPRFRPCGQRDRRLIHLYIEKSKQTDVSNGLNKENATLRL